MQVQFKLLIGKNEYTLIETVESNADFFKKLHFYSSLPQLGPNGEDDLVLRYRIAQKQYEYYSIVSEKAGMEFKFGQQKEGNGVLFPKGWEPLYKAEQDGAETGEVTQPTGGLGTPVTQATPTPAAAVTHTGLGAPPAAAAPKAAAPKAATPPPTGAPNVSNQAKNILQKFGV